MKMHFREYRKFIPTDSSVLDIGTGTGSTLNYINQHIPNLRVHGLDIINHLDFPSDLDRTIYDGFTVPFASNAFDIVLLLYTLRHVEQPKQVLVEAARVAREQIIVIEEFEDSVIRPRKSQKKLADQAIRLSLGEGYHSHMFTQTNFEALFDSQFAITKHIILPTTTENKLQKHLYVLNVNHN